MSALKKMDGGVEPAGGSGPVTEPRIAGMLKKMPRWRYTALAVLTAAMAVFQAYDGLVKPLRTWTRLPLHLCFALVIVFLFNPMAKRGKNRDSRFRNLWWIYDALMIGGACFAGGYFLFCSEALELRAPGLMSALDIAAAAVLLIVLLEAVRRMVSRTLLCVILLFAAYALCGQHLSGIFHFDGMTLRQLCETLVLGQKGIFGSPLAASMGTLFYLMVFGAFFSGCCGSVLIDAGMKLSDRTAGGPAKAAVVSSGLLGMTTGFAAANVATTGVLTIPRMKKAGYSPEEAGAVESVASTGGQIMPPVMGAGAFIMAEMIGLPYARVAAAAIIPAAAYFGAAFVLVHLLARKKRMTAGDPELGYAAAPILPRLYRLTPVVLLVIAIFVGVSIPRAAICCTVLSIAIGMLSGETRMRPGQLLQTLMEGVRKASNIAIPTAACGMVIGIAAYAGVGAKVAGFIGASGSAGLLLTLLAAAACCLLMGMALPTVASYLIAGALFCCAIESLGVEPLVANMFLFYFGVVAQITPPVCRASFTAAGIAGASVWKTGWKAFFFAATAFVIPFMFVYHPAILLIGSAGEIAVSCLMMACATFFLAAGVAGYAGKDLSVLERALFFAAALILALPAFLPSIGGLLLGIVLIGWCIMGSRKNMRTAA